MKCIHGIHFLTKMYKLQAQAFLPVWGRLQPAVGFSPPWAAWGLYHQAMPTPLTRRAFLAVTAASNLCRACAPITSPEISEQSSPAEQVTAKTPDGAKAI